MSDPGLIPHPNDKDVLCGRGSATRSHPGNVLFISLVQKRKTSYSMSPKGNKLGIVKRVVDEIRNNDGRFLTRKGEGWVDIGTQKALIKTSQAFRDVKNDDSVENDNQQHAVTSKKETTMKPKPKFSFLLNRFAGQRNPKLAITSSSSACSSDQEDRQDDATVNQDQIDDDNDDDASSSSSTSRGDADETSDTETEDSFPMHRAT